MGKLIAVVAMIGALHFGAVALEHGASSVDHRVHTLVARADQVESQAQNASNDEQAGLSTLQRAESENPSLSSGH